MTPNRIETRSKGRWTQVPRLSVFLLAGVILVGCKCYPPEGPEFQFNVSSPINKAIARGNWSAAGTAPRIRRALDEMVGSDRSVAAYERALRGEGAVCKHDGVVRCHFRHAYAGGMMIEDTYFDVEVTLATPKGAKAALVAVCVQAFFRRPEERGRIQPPPKNNTESDYTCV
jgi:hypothetical protein